MQRSLTPHIAAHFAGRDRSVRQIYELILRRANEFGRVSEDPKKTSIHLVNRSAFAGIQTRNKHLILTLKSANEIQSSRFSKSVQTSANRWHLETRLDSPAMVDDELVDWLRAAYQISG